MKTPFGGQPGHSQGCFLGDAKTTLLCGDYDSLGNVSYFFLSDCGFGERFRILFQITIYIYICFFLREFQMFNLRFLGPLDVYIGFSTLSSDQLTLVVYAACCTRGIVLPCYIGIMTSHYEVPIMNQSEFHELSAKGFERCSFIHLVFGNFRNHKMFGNL